MMTLPDTLRRRIGRFVHKVRRFRGHIDGYVDTALVGWVAAHDPGQGACKVGVFSSQGLITEATANIYRDDVVRAGIGTGHCGFYIPLDAIMLRAIRANGGRVRVRTLAEPGFEIGQIDLSGAGDARPQSPANPQSPALGEGLPQFLFGALQQLAGLHEIALATPPIPAHPIPAPPIPAAQQAPLTRHKALFASTDYLNGGPLNGLMTGYSEYLYYRDKLEDRFDVHGDPAETAHFLSWFLAHYSCLRGGLRVPIAKSVLDYLNTPVVIFGERISFTRATWSFMLGTPPILQTTEFTNPEWVAWAMYWWAVERAQSLHVEDCLVPQSYIDQLAAIPGGWQGSAFAPSHFMQRIHAQTPALRAIDLHRLEGRQQLLLALMVMAAQRPDYLRYLPPHDVGAMLADGPAALSPFARFCHEMAPQSASQPAPPQPAPILRRADYAAILRLKGFDLATGTFLTFTPEGHRVEAAMLPPVSTSGAVDLQLIGPFEKASGLGQATRLSASVIARIGADLPKGSGITVNSVNFGLDNPAPEGFSRVGALSGYKRAKINLIHLNAESIPLAFAYQPDVFSGAYNIGYFFWELNTPAACHYLGMDLLDEIWVSTDYGLQIYQPEFKGPVTNVGMCFEELPRIDRAEARAIVQGLSGFEPGRFVFLVAFDSFSFIQRKNPLGALRAFKTAFEGVKDVGLLIKTQNRRKVADPVQIAIWQQVDALIKDDPRIVVVNETLSYADLLKLKSGCDCYVSLHKSEGWGFGMIEAMNLGVPVICTAYSGNMEFCTPETAWLVDYTLTPLAADDYIFVRAGQVWAEPDVADAARQMRAVRADAGGRSAKTDAALALVQQNFSADAIARRYQARLGEILKTLETPPETLATPRAKTPRAPRRAAKD